MMDVNAGAQRPGDVMDIKDQKCNVEINFKINNSTFNCTELKTRREMPRLV